MIHMAMQTIAEDLNVFFRQRKGDSKDRIILSSLTDPQGSIPADAEDNVFFFLTHISEEKNIGQNGKSGNPPGLVARFNPPIYLNLHVVFAAMYRRYETGLQALSEVIAYLQGKPIYTPQNTPAMDPAVGTLAFKMINLDYAQQSYLWGSLGAKYVPSVVYSLRLLHVGEAQIEALIPPITRPNVTGQAQAAG